MPISHFSSQSVFISGDTYAFKFMVTSSIFVTDGSRNRCLKTEVILRFKLNASSVVGISTQGLVQIKEMASGNKKTLHTCFNSRKH